MDARWVPIACGVCSAALALPAVAADSLRAGVAQEKITPKTGCHLGGYPNIRVAQSVKSELYAKAIVFESGGKRMAIVANDLIFLTAEIVAAAKATIAKKCGIPPEAVMICATHTHTGPELRDRKDRPYGSDPAYNAELAQKIAAVVERACGSMFDATIGVGQADEATGFARNRYLRLKDGRDMEYYGPTPPQGTGCDEEVVGFVSPVDAAVRTLWVRDSEKKVRAVAVNFANHPNSGKKADYVCAEWPGATAKCIGEKFGAEVPCLVLQGTAGDVQRRPDIGIEAGGKSVAEAAIKGIEGAAAPLAKPALDWRMEALKIPYCAKAELAGYIEEYKRKHPNETDAEKRFRKVLQEKLGLWDKDGKTADVPVQCLRIGDVAVVGLPGEPFTALGAEIRKNSPAKTTLVVGYANDWTAGYVPPADQTNREAYGERPCESRYLAADAARLMVDSAVKSLRELWK